MDKEYSGVSWYAHNLAKQLIRFGRFGLDKEWLMFANSSRGADLPDLGYAKKIFRYPNKLLNLSLGFFKRPRLDKWCGGADVFLAPNLSFVAVSDSCRLIVAVHDLSFLIYPEFFTLKQRIWHKLILASGLLERADRIITDSENTKRDLIELLKLPEDKITVIYPGVGEKYRQELDAEKLKRVREKYDLPEKFFLFVSSLEPRKNLFGVLRALDRIDGAKLVITGAGGWKNNKERKIIAGHKQVKLLGYVPEEDKPALYHLSRALVYPSFYEGFGLPILEAMASGCPVIAGNNSSQGEVLGDCGLLVDPYNTKDIAEAMSVLWQDDLLWQELSARGRERSKLFGWEKLGEEVLKLIVNN